MFGLERVLLTPVALDKNLNLTFWAQIGPTHHLVQRAPSQRSRAHRIPRLPLHTTGAYTTCFTGSYK
jgi:hypothetical protein